MAILEMEKIYIYGLHSDRKAVLEDIHKSGMVEISETDGEDLKYKETAKSISQFDEFMKSAESAIGILDEYAPEKSGMFANRRILPINKYSMKTTESDIVLKHSYQIIRLSDKIREYTENIRKMTEEQIALEPYITLDIPMDVNKTVSTNIKMGTLNGMWSSEQLQKSLDEDGLNCVHYEFLNISKENSYVWFVFLKCHEQKMYSFLQEIGFSEPSFGFSNNCPMEKSEILKSEKYVLSQEIEQCITKIKKLADYRRDIELFYDHLRLRKEKYQVLSKMGMTEHTFLIEGCIPKKYGTSIKQALENKYTVYVELTEPEQNEEMPVVFQNNVFSAPVEGITETYSMPSDNDIDPNPVMAFFYYVFFGMMFSDAGYGLLLMLVCGLLGFGKILEKHKRKNYQMFFFCGVSTVFWGMMYGSFFGNIINMVSVTFFHKDITFAPIWIDPVSEPLTALVFSVALGMIQILVGLIIKFYMLCRQKKVLDAVFDVGFWIMVLLGISLFAAGLGTNVPLLAEIGKYGAILGAVGLVLTGGRQNKSIVGKLFGGILGLYDIASYASDALSYSRLMALGLATGVISGVINMLGVMSGNSLIGVAAFIMISIIGHVINFAINMLGAYVHTNRLQYVEFYSKFYEGGGRKFAPFYMDTKYYRFSEE